MAEQFRDHEQVVCGGVCRGGKTVPQRVRGIAGRQQMADMVSDIGFLDMASEPAGEKIASRVHDGRRQVIRQRHDALFVSLAAHDQRMADTVCHHVIAVHGGYLATSQSALRAETDR